MLSLVFSVASLETSSPALRSAGKKPPSRAQDRILTTSIQIQARSNQARVTLERTPREALRGPQRETFFQGFSYLYAFIPPDRGKRRQLFPLSIFRKELTIIFLDMLSGPILAMVWEGREAVKTGRSKLPCHRTLPRFVINNLQL